MNDHATPPLIGETGLLQPIRGEPFGADRLEQFAQPLAAAHVVLPGIRAGKPLLVRLRQNGEALLRSYRVVAAAVHDNQPISPAAEWLVDNYHIIEDQLREIREDLPRGFYRKLPKLAGGGFAGYPRVFAMAWAYVEHTDSRFDPAVLSRFVQAYQQTQPLTLGELWAVAISLRLVLVENLRRLADRVVERRAARAAADALADALPDGVGATAADPEAVDHWQRSPLWGAFVTQLVRRLRDRDPGDTPLLAALQERLTAERRTAEDLVQQEQQAQVAAHLLMRNVITSMRLMSSVDWNELIEGLSLVEAALRDGTDVAAMDFKSRDRYRHAVEDLAQGSRQTEIEVARRAAAQARAAPRGTAEADPGWPLIGGGRRAFERDLGFRVPLRQWPARALRAAASPVYLGLILASTLVIAALPAAFATADGIGTGALLALALLALVPASEPALALVNRLIPDLVGPHRLPRLELLQGVPEALRTMVVVPVLLTGERSIDQQIALLEVHHLANADGDLRFALLSDWRDAAAETEPGDEDLLAHARAGIATLNRCHPPAPDGGPRFFLFHRRRMWNAGEGVWMGWERKRGKLHEFNRLLRGATDTTYLPDRGEPATAPAGVRFVITLDADTRLPRGAARKMIGTLAHPLNRPVHDPAAGRVVRGHAILQPRIAPTLPEVGDGTLHQRVYAGPRGIDAYEFAISDVYQDLFGEGIFTGKGIYDVDAFERALAGRVPENMMLSHDLFEGIAARAALLSDVELFEDYPAHWEAGIARRHRWARGDWQLLPWLLGRVRRQGDEPGGLPPIGRWKMIDNLRRSLVPPLALALLIAGWCLPGALPALMTAFVFGVFAVPGLMPLVGHVGVPRRDAAPRLVLSGIGDDLRLGAMQALLAMVLLAELAWVMGDAILRTLWRIVVSHRHRLEWVTAAQARANVDLDLAGCYRRMSGGLVLGLAAAAVALAANPAAWEVAVPMAALWLLGPVVARAISLAPAPDRRAQPTAEQTRLMRGTARRTWHFFERFVGAEDNFLPPDNFQEDPAPKVAHRTSPTNIGLYLLSAVAARDFGWTGTADLADRLEATFATLRRMEQYRGHLYNWYETTTLAPLEPRYISTVDSGNLAGHLIALRQACLAWADTLPPASRAVDGIRDTLDILRETAKVEPGERSGTVIQARELDREIAGLAPVLDAIAGGDSEEVVAAWDDLGARAETLVDTARAIAGERATFHQGGITDWALTVAAVIAGHRRDRILSCRALQDRLLALAGEADRLSRGMHFDFLFNRTQKLFAIGFRPADIELDAGTYDLLASEARLASLVAIARGEVSPDHWFRLGRPMTGLGGGAALVSWSASMFEYLMPDLVVRVPAGSLLAQTARLVVQHQIAYGRERGVPWGISESAYNVRDLHLTYQYSNFGVAGLGLKRGLSGDLVIAPYATALAAMVDPAAAALNYAGLAAAGVRGAYGYYEAVDYTADRLPDGTGSAIIRAYMAHHQGMTVVALANALCGGLMRSRFHAAPEIRAVELLLQERVPRTVTLAPVREPRTGPRVHERESVPAELRRFHTPHNPTPRAHLLTNGRYTVMVTAAGSGYSRWNGLAVTRWREDATRDCWGSYIYVKDIQDGRVWSTGYQPSGVEADDYEVTYSEERAEFRRRDGTLLTTMAVVVAPEDDVELRQVTVRNLGARRREIELTSFAELVLAPQAADLAHPAFSNLFVQTEFVPGLEVLVATRRPRAADEPPIWAAHLAVAPGAKAAAQYETDRACFLGRGHDARAPAALIDGRPLSNTLGAVLDPAFSLRRRLLIEPGGTGRVIFATLAAGSREDLLALADRYRDETVFERTQSQAWTRAQVQLRHLGIGRDEAHLFQRLATRLLFVDPLLRAPRDVLQSNRRGADALWQFGISGDRPIVLVRADEGEPRDLARQLLSAQEYWRLHGLIVDLVFINDQVHSYYQEVQTALEGLVRASQAAGGGRDHGGVFVLKRDRLAEDDLIVLRTAARVTLSSGDGTLAEQVVRLLIRQPAPEPSRAVPPLPPPEEVPPPRPSLELFNGIGGFAKGGQEYVIILGARQATPAPWINVVANPDFGFVVSESGSGFTWCGNSHENQLTPWSNDPVSDPPGEVIYVRDDDTGETWTATPLPVREDTPYVIRHGLGYTRFEHASHGLVLTLVLFAAPADAVKVSHLTIENRSRRPRSLTVTAYAEWVLGPARAISAPFVMTGLDPLTHAMFVRNPWNQDFAQRIAFLDMAGHQTSWTGDRTEFIGRNGSLDRPAGLAPGATLSGRVGADMDPCTAMQTVVSLAVDERAEVTVLLGQGRDADEARRLVLRYRAERPDQLLGEVGRQWDDVVGGLRVRTPERSMDLLLNGWLLYQVLGCRVWGRSGFYQNGGAYGFRDQLQDTMALAAAQPSEARAQLLRAAARQFREGDVQHWWHPPSGKGVRTRISDDLLWLPYATLHYVEVTGDAAVLESEVPFLDGPPLAPDQHDAYFAPAVSVETASLYEHCARAFDARMAVGRHGLPPIGTGDWNDGMNRVGQDGEGESVWLAWFLIAGLDRFAPLAAARGDATRAERWRSRVASLRLAVERDGWDGDWYRRAFFDDGTPLGSAANIECRVDSLAQSWAVLSGAGDPVRAARALAAVDEYLVRQVDGLILLLTPPFDRAPVDPGYIKGYLPGIRENGGQYSHAAVWVVMAAAALGQGDRAVELFNLINPVNHARTRVGVQHYRVEPYVMAGDVYGELPHVGRGGWTWYTGSAAWMYRAGVESILGFRLRGRRLGIDPCIPSHWPGFKLSLRYHSARYEILVDNPDHVSRGVHSLTLDGQVLAGADSIELADDGIAHTVELVLGGTATEATGPAATGPAPMAAAAPG